MREKKRKILNKQNTEKYNLKLNRKTKYFPIEKNIIKQNIDTNRFNFF